MVHKIKGTVVKGNSIGRCLGFPTANVAISPEMPVKDGVYAAEVNVEGKVYQAMVNIGRRPTVDESGGRFAEAHLFGFSEDIYGREIIIFLLGSIRPEEKFDGIEALKAQIERDKEAVIDHFAAMAKNA